MDIELPTVTRFSQDIDGTMEPDEDHGRWVRFDDHAEAMRAAVAAAVEREREACARMCDDMDADYWESGNG